MKKKENILFVAHTSGLNGAERSLCDVLRYLDKNAYSVFVCCPSGDSGRFIELVSKIDDVHLSVFPYRWTLADRNSLSKKILLFLWQFIAVWPIIFLILKKNISIICTNTVTVGVGAIAAKILRKKHIWWVRESLKAGNVGFYIFGEKLYEKFINLFSDLVIFNSNWTMLEYEFILSIKKKVVYNGFAFKEAIRVKVNQIRKERGKNKSILLGVAGKISQHKGQLDAVYVLNELVSSGIDASLNLYGSIGDQDYAKKITELCTSLDCKNRVTLVGFENRREIVYSNIDILLVPSYVEPFGRVVVEGMYYGCVVIAAPIGGMNEIISNGVNGFLVDFKRTSVVVSIIKRLLNDKIELKNIIKNAMLEVDKYSIDRTLNQFQALLKTQHEGI